MPNTLENGLLPLYNALGKVLRMLATAQTPAPAGAATPSGLSMGRAHSANTELAELSTIFLKPK